MRWGFVKGLWEEHWYLRENFNVVIFPFERSFDGCFNWRVKSFSNFIKEFGLIDIPIFNLASSINLAPFTLNLLIKLPLL